MTRPVFRRLALLAALSAASLFAAVLPAGADIRGSKLQPTVIPNPYQVHGRSRPLACNDNTTIGQEGCQERQNLTLISVLNADQRVIFGLLHDNAARRRLNTAQVAWLSYAKADCVSQSDVYEGGSEAPVIAGVCLVSQDTARIADLKTFYSMLIQATARPPAFPEPPAAS
ncbi:MAG TPA: lysozyme inhibitor LprI family protein [Acidimicrobiales bacterium]|jgi:uncharacterized protein YecT (DUF1311 family)